jgi:hypothetical protein
MIVVHAAAPSRYVPAHEWGFTSAQEMPLTLISRFSTFPDNASQNAPTVGKPPMPAPASARWVAVHASRVRTRRQVRAMRAAASTTKMPVSMPWKAQNLVAGW